MSSTARIRQRNHGLIQDSITNFQVSDTMLLGLLMGQHVVDDPYKSDKFKESLPQNLLNYRYLMHPIRLTIMKILNDQDKMRSAEIRYILGVSWGEYRPHIKSLEERGYIEINNEFNTEGSASQTVQILEEGRREYLELFDLLIKFTHRNSPFNRILHQNRYSFGDDLYPVD